MHLPEIPGGKKLIYTHVSLPLTAISDFEEKGKSDPFFAELDRICKKHNGLWNAEAEKYLLTNAKKNLIRKSAFTHGTKASASLTPGGLAFIIRI